MGHVSPTRPHGFKGVRCRGSRRALRTKRQLNCIAVGTNRPQMSRFERARGAAIRLVKHLFRRYPKAIIGVQFFDTRSIDIEPVQFYKASEQTQLIGRLDNKQPIMRANTPLYYSLLKSVRHMRSLAGRPSDVDKVILLLTDGVDDTRIRERRVDPYKLLQELQPGGGRAKVRVFPIKLDIWGGSQTARLRLQRSKARFYMQQFASLTQGEMISIPPGRYDTIKKLFGGQLFQGSYLFVGESIRFKNNPGRTLQEGLSYTLEYKLKRCSPKQGCPPGNLCRNGFCQEPCLNDKQCEPGERCRSGSCIAPSALPPYMKVSTSSFRELTMLLLGSLGVWIVLWLLGLIPIGGSSGSSSGGSGGGGGRKEPPAPAKPAADPNPPGKKPGKFVVDI